MRAGLQLSSCRALYTHVRTDAGPLHWPTAAAPTAPGGHITHPSRTHREGAGAKATERGAGQRACFVRVLGEQLQGRGWRGVRVHVRV